MDKFLYALIVALPPLLSAFLIGVFLIWRKMRIVGWVIIAIGLFWSLVFFYFFWNWPVSPAGSNGAFGFAQEQITTPAFIILAADLRPIQVQE